MTAKHEGPSWREEDPRRAALSFLIRYWGLGAMRRERGLSDVPLLPFGEVERVEDERV